MSKTLTSFKGRVTLLAIVTLSVVAVSVYEFVPKCSVFAQKVTGIIASATHNSSFATAPVCSEKSGANKEVYFVSCGGFF